MLGDPESEPKLFKGGGAPHWQQWSGAVIIMKKGKHPEYQEVLFVDSATGHRFVCGSTLKPTKREVFEGKEYPAYYVSISSASHPFFLDKKGSGRHVVDVERRIDRFMNKYAEKAAQAKAQQQKAPVAPPKPIAKKPTRSKAK